MKTNYPYASSVPNHATVSEFAFLFYFLGSDCFEIGRQSYNGGDFYYAESWLDEALRKNDPTIRWMILEYLTRAAFINGKSHLGT